MERFEVVAKSALCIIPPEDLWTRIQAIRKVHDKQFNRWMPHINLLYPFYENKDGAFTIAASAAKNVCRDISPICLTFDSDSFDYFTHKKSSTLLLKPRESQIPELTILHKKLQDWFPDAGDKRFPEFKPHLSLGQFSANEVQKFRDKFADEWKRENVRIDWVVDAVQLISREDFDDPFHVIETVNLG